MLLSFQKETMHAEASLKACQQFKAKVAFQELCLLFGLTLLIHHGGVEGGSQHRAARSQAQVLSIISNRSRRGFCKIWNRLMSMMYEKAGIRMKHRSDSWEY